MTYLTKNLAFFSNLDGMQAICAEKVFVEKLPQSRCARQIPPFVTCGDIFPRPGEVVLGDGAFGIAAQFPAKAQSFRSRQRLPPRGSWQSRQALTEGVQTVTPSVCSLRSQPAPPRGRLCREGQLSRHHESRPLGEGGIAAGDDGRGTPHQKSRAACGLSGFARFKRCYSVRGKGVRFSVQTKYIPSRSCR